MKQGKVREFYLNKTNTHRPAEESQMINPEKKVVKEKLSLFSRFANLGKNNQKYNKNSKLLIYKIKNTKDQQKDYDIKIVIDNYVHFIISYSKI